MTIRYERLNPLGLISGALLILICSLCAILFFMPGASVTLADCAEASVPERQITPIIVNSPYLRVPALLQYAKVVNIKGSSATLKIWIGPGGGVELDHPVEVTRARIGIEYVDYRNKRKLAQMYATISAGPVCTGAVEMKPSIALPNIPENLEYIIIWVENMDISGKEYVPTKKIDIHDSGLAIIRERERLASLFSTKGLTDLLIEVSSVFRE